MHYLAPGGLVITSILATWIALEGPLPDLADYGVALVFFFAFSAYVAGAIMHLGAGTVERLRKKKWGGFPGVTMLAQSDSRLAPAFKQRLRSRIRIDFGLDLSTAPKRDENANEAFNLCYAWLEARGLAGGPRRHELEYQLLRNMQFAAAVTLVIGLDLFVQIVANLFDSTDGGILVKTDGTTNWAVFGISMLFLATSVFFVGFTSAKVKSLLVRFCASVYQTYYAIREVETRQPETPDHGTSS